MIKIGVSACLLGKNVRYDGGNKYINLAQYFNVGKYQFMALCPEVEMGMTIPRPAIQIIKDQTNIRLVQVDNREIDYSQQMHQWFLENLDSLKCYAGFILKSKSPSCGQQTTPHYSNQGLFERQDGFFVNLLKSIQNDINIIDENQLMQPDLVDNFIQSLSAVTKNK
jgi:uncharacterized protein YbbK (DUF523 family)